MNFINLTPHDIVMNDGTIYPSQGIARLADTYTPFDENKICDVTYGNINNLPSPKENTCYIVSSLVLNVAKALGRKDVVTPATGHPDSKRHNGNIVSVPGFIR